MVFPKSDLQRKRLADSVANILLFRSLDKVNWNVGLLSPDVAN